MHIKHTSTAILALLPLTLGRPTESKRAAPPTYVANPSRANAVKAAFQRSWDGYYKYAFPHDSLRPISNGWYDDRLVFCVVDEY
jgi:mannosyl-oligosaccharide alpha-1,2-mannosidase